MFSTLRAKLFGGYLAILLLVAALGVYAIFSFRSLSAITTSGLDLNAQSTLANVRMYESLVRMNEGSLKILGAEALQGRKFLNEQPSIFYSELRNAQRTVAAALPSVRARISEILTKVEVSWQQYEALLPEFMRKADANPLDARAFYERAMTPVYNELKTLTFSLFEENVTAFQAARQTTSDEARSATVAIITVTLVALGLGFIASVIIARRTTKPLQDISKNLKELQAGNLSARLPVITADELGDVSFEFNRMTERLQIAFSDITHFKELDQMKSDFIAKVSHEFRTPLTSMKMALDLLDRGALGTLNGDQRDLVVTSKKDTDRLDKLIRDLLVISRLESGASREINVSTNAAECFDELIRSLQILFGEKKVSLQVYREEITDVAIVKSDLESVLQNLLSNALKFTPSGGKVGVLMKREDQTLVIIVSDSGIGISASDKERIFEKFVQLKPTDSATPGSVGLGLAIVSEIAKKYNGTAFVESIVGKGSTFTVKLKV